MYHVVLVVLLCVGCAGSGPAEPLAEDGLLDLSAWDFEKDGSVELRGEWRFVWSELTEATPGASFRNQHQDTMVVPGFWAKGKSTAQENAQISNTGYATYVLEIGLPEIPASANLALLVHHVKSAANWQVYSASEQLLLASARQGIPGVSAETSTPIWIGTSSTLPSNTGTRVIVMAHVSNFHYAHGGIGTPPVLGLSTELAQSTFFSSLLRLLLFSVLILVALYHFIAFCLYPTEKVLLYFAGFCLAVALQHVVKEGFFPQIGVGWSTVGFSWLRATETITMQIASIFFGLYLHELLPSKFFKRFVYSWPIGVGGILIVFTLLSDPITHTQNRYIYDIHFVLGAIVVFWHLGVRAHDNNETARFLLLASAVVAVGVLNDILYANTIIQTGHVSALAFIAFILAQTYLLSRMLSSTLEHRSYLRRNLEGVMSAIDKAGAIAVTDTRATIIEASDSFCSLSGYAREELIGQNIRILNSGYHETEFFESLWETLLAANMWHGDICNKRKSGEMYWSETTIVPLLDSDEKPSRFFVVRIDSSAEHRREIAATAKLATLGELSAGVAHEMNQPLNFINGVLQLIRTEARDRTLTHEKTTELSTDAISKVKRINRIIIHMGMFSRQYDVEYSTVNIRTVIENAQLLLSDKIKMQDVQVDLDIADNVPTLLANEGHLEQVFINLFQNSLDALQNKEGNAQISISMKEGDKSTKQERLIISFSDNGSGMHHAITTRIFEPFYTTKEVGKGTGLGLSLSYGIINDHGGRISCRSELGVGTAFEIVLPTNKNALE